MDAPRIRLLTRWEQQRCGCNEGWICEQHSDRGWPHEDCAGPGMPCPRCNPAANARRLAVAGQVASPMNTTTLRDVWNGHPVELREAWTLRKRNHVAVCRLWSHEFGWGAASSR
jgi:hypothetical protein